jgi:hypothetical protein
MQNQFLMYIYEAREIRNPAKNPAKQRNPEFGSDSLL